MALRRRKETRLWNWYVYWEMVLKLIDECFFVQRKQFMGTLVHRSYTTLHHCFLPRTHYHSSNVHVYIYFYSTIKLLSYRAEEIILPRVYRNWNSDFAHHAYHWHLSSVYPRLCSSHIVSFFCSDFRGRGQLTTSLPEAGWLRRQFRLRVWLLSISLVFFDSSGVLTLSHSQPTFWLCRRSNCTLDYVGCVLFQGNFRADSCRLFFISWQSNSHVSRFRFNVLRIQM